MHEQKSTHSHASMDSEKAELASICCLAWNYLQKNREREIFNLETHLAFLGYMEASGNVKRQTLKYYTIKIFPIEY